MASNITYELSFQGLDQNIVKLTRLDSLLKSIGRNSGLTSGNVNVNASQSGGSGGNVTGNVLQAATLGVMGAGISNLSKQMGSLTSKLQAVIGNLSSQIGVLSATLKPAVASQVQKVQRILTGQIPPTETLPGGQPYGVHLAARQAKERTPEGSLLRRLAVDKSNAPLGGEDFSGTVKAINNRIALAAQLGTPVSASGNILTPEGSLSKANKSLTLKENSSIALMFRKVQQLLRSGVRNRAAESQLQILLELEKMGITTKNVVGENQITHVGGFKGVKQLSPEEFSAAQQEASVKAHEANNERQKEILFKKLYGGKYKIHHSTGKTGTNPQQEQQQQQGIFGKESRELVHGLSRSLGIPELGKLFGEFGKLGIAVGITIAALVAFRKGIEEATEASREAARQGLSVATSNRINGAFSAIGLKTPDLSSITPLLGKSREGDYQAIINAAMMGKFGEEGQQLLNMSLQFRLAMGLSTNSIREMNQAAKATTLINIQTADIGREWKSLLAQLVELFQPLIVVILAITELFLKLVNLLLEGINLFNNPIFRYLNSKLTGENKQYLSATGQYTPAGTNSLEKLGFVMGGSSPTKHLADINKHTAVMADGITKLVQFAGGGGHSGGSRAGGSWIPRLPQLP